MGLRKIILAVTCIFLILVGGFTESLLPVFVMIFILDFYRKNSFLKKRINYIKSRSKAKFIFLEWIFAILLSVWTFQVVKNSFVGVYTFSTSSMNGTLEAGDLLLVNKTYAGARRFANSVNRYHRSPAFNKLHHNDIIVFNFPEGDTLLMKRPTESYYYLKRKYGDKTIKEGSGKLSDLHFFNVTDRPRFVKRIYGLPGDTIGIVDGVLMANHKILKMPLKSIDRYLVTEQQKDAIRKLGIIPYNELTVDEGLVMELYYKDYEVVKDKGINIVPDYLPKNYPDSEVFPFDREMLWNMNNMGPLYIPKKGDEIELNEHNILIYRRIIDVFEDNELVFKNGEYIINGKKVSKYKFKMNYYWVIGDNFYHSFDSRFWGFVPENHIIGKVSKVFH